MRRARGLLPALWILSACTPEVGAPLSVITTPRVLAIRGEPAEAPPGAIVTWDALVATPDGSAPSAALAWSFCVQPRPLAQATAVNDACLEPGGTTALSPPAPTLTAPIPTSACQLFGSELPPQTPTNPEPRPRDPDATGGYYQPLLVTLDGAPSVALLRLRCNLRGASMPVADAFRARYTANRNPQLATVVVPSAVRVGETIELVATWAADDAEIFPVFDVLTQQLVDHREALRVSWFATAGQLALERSGRAADDLALDARNQFTAPATPGRVHLWIVLRDSRGGVGWQSADLDVVP